MEENPTSKPGCSFQVYGGFYGWDISYPPWFLKSELEKEIGLNQEQLWPGFKEEFAFWDDKTLT